MVYFSIGLFAPNTETETSKTGNAYTMNVSGVTTEELGNIKFNVPSYYDVRVTKDDVYNVYFYPETEDASATIGFILTNKGYSSNDVKNSKDAIINNWKQTFANLTAEELMIGDNYVLKSTGSRDGAKMKGAAVVNNANKETVIVVLSVDDTDKTNNNYFGDFDKMINNVVFSTPIKQTEAPHVVETTQIIETVVKNEEETTKAKTQSIAGIDYYNAADFEADLEAGKNLEGKTALMICDELHPQSVYGYNIWAGKHINLVSSRNPNVEAGEEILIKATEINSNLGSWIIKYEKFDKKKYMK